MNNLIVVIDDSLVIRKIIAVTLQRAGYPVLTFPDGIATLRWLMHPDAQTPALIFLDISLPKLNGYEIARYLKARSRFADTPIVMITRRNGIIDRLKARLAGASVYLTKPLDTETILATVQAYVKVPEGPPVAMPAASGDAILHRGRITLY